MMQGAHLTADFNADNFLERLDAQKKISELYALTHCVK
jgi:hypothetical protein